MGLDSTTCTYVNVVSIKEEALNDMLLLPDCSSCSVAISVDVSDLIVDVINEGDVVDVTDSDGVVFIVGVVADEGGRVCFLLAFCFLDLLGSSGIFPSKMLTP